MFSLCCLSQASEAKTQEKNTVLTTKDNKKMSEHLAKQQENSNSKKQVLALNFHLSTAFACFCGLCYAFLGKK